MKERHRIYPFILLGRKIGTHSGISRWDQVSSWDQGDMLDIIVYDFKPIEGVDLPAREDICFSFETGLANWYDDVPKVLPEDFNWRDHEKSVDFVPLIIHVPLENK